MDFDRLAKMVEKEDKAREARQGIRTGKLIQPKNRGPAPVQITAEQLLRESLEFKESLITAPQQTIANKAELAEYQLRKRKEFEDSLRRQKHNIGTWIRYAAWEATHQQWGRVRSIYERAIDIDYRNTQIWLKYIEFELKNRFIAHARNLFDRAVTLHPRINAFWYKYVQMEETLGDIQATRNVFTRWMTFEPDERAWQSYIKFELRYKQYDRIRQIYQQYTIIHHTAATYIKYARFEEQYGHLTVNTDSSKPTGIPQARHIYELALHELTSNTYKSTADKHKEQESILIAYAEFETRQREYDRVRALYHYALDHVSRATMQVLFNKYAAFEKQYGNAEQVEVVILKKRRIVYEDELATHPYQYDIYFDYLALEQAMPQPDHTIIRSLFQRAITQLPKDSTHKQSWKRYIYLWIYLLIYEELTMKDMTRVKEIYEKCLTLLSTLPFAFSKIWLMYADFCLRCHDLDSARKVYGLAIAKVHKPNIYHAYIEMEFMLGNIDRCRIIYEKWLEAYQSAANVWFAYAEMEETLQETDRWRRICELAINQPVLDQPEKIWKGYIDMEIRAIHSTTQQQEHPQPPDPHDHVGDRVRDLYQRLLLKTQHVKVWISFAQFEAGRKQWQKARDVFTRGHQHMKDKMKEMSNNIQQIKQQHQQQQQNITEEEPANAGTISTTNTSAAEDTSTTEQELLLLKEERVLLLTSWYEYVCLYGSAAEQAAVKALMPTQVKKRREQRDSETFEVLSGLYEEYIDYIFPEAMQTHTAAMQGLKLMERAKMWKKEQALKKKQEVQKEQGQEDKPTQQDSSMDTSKRDQ